MSFEGVEDTSFKFNAAYLFEMHNGSDQPPWADGTTATQSYADAGGKASRSRQEPMVGCIALLYRTRRPAPT